MNNLPAKQEFNHWDGDDWDEIGFEQFESEGIHTTKPTAYRQISQGRFPPPISPGKWYRGQLRDHKRQRACEAQEKQKALRQKSTLG